MPVDLARAYTHPLGISCATYSKLSLFNIIIMGKGANMIDSKLGDGIANSYCNGLFTKQKPQRAYL